MSDEETEITTKGLDKLLKALKNPPQIRVGILGDQPRQDGGLNNATIGAFHEFGTSKTPVRSFLRLPISALLDKKLKAADVLSKETAKEVVTKGSLMLVCQKIATIAEAIVAEAFDTGGFGFWVKSDMSRKKNHQTLVETQQLRNSITSEVKERA